MGRKTASRRLFSKNRLLTSLLSTISISAIVLSAFYFDVEHSFAQTTSSKTSKIATPEEASGTSVRDFNALRALNRDYLNNPDGGETPLDVDDLWIPDMALAKKTAKNTNAGVRVITYDNGAAKTETRSVGPSQSNQRPSQDAQTSVKKQTNQPTIQNSSSQIASAQHEAPVNAAPKIRQTSGFADYSLGEGYVSPSQGFADYQLGGSEPAYVALRDEEPVQTSGNATTPLDDFPSIDSFDAAPIVDNATEDALPVRQQSSINVVESNAPQETLYASTPSVNSGLDSLLSNPETSTTPIAESTESASNVVLGDFPIADMTPFPEVEIPSLITSPSDNPETPTPVTTPEPTTVPVATLPNEDNAPALVASRVDDNVVTSATGETYKPIDLLSEPETDHTVANGDDEPFRESYKVSDLNRIESKTPKKEDVKQGQSLESAPLSESELKNLTVEDVRISGLEMTAQQFNKIVKTRIGAKFNQQRLEEDKRALLQTKQFIDVAVSTSWSPDKPDKVVVNFDLTPRRMMRYIKVVGNRKISKHDILEELALKPGESRMDPYEVENGRLRIIEFYKSKDYGEPHVEILRGDRPEDVGVVYLIDEGLKQRVLSTKFVGNSIVSSARLHSLVSVKPGFLYFIGGAFTRERLDADVEKLLEYYRNLGYFDARIDREYEEGRWFGGIGKDNAWVSVRYIIDEGPRYKIRNFVFNGNRVVKSDELAKTLKVKKGSYYRFDEIEADRIALRYKYQDLGYVRADVTPNQIFTDEVGVVDIRYDINEDHRYRVRDVIVDYVGTESRTMTPVVLNMLDVSPGELLNGKKIRMSENTLRQSGYFNDKPSDGQLPEIAVIPDESKSYKLNSAGRAELVRDSSVEDNQKNSRDARRDSDTTRGQSSKTRVYREQNHVTRG